MRASLAVLCLALAGCGHGGTAEDYPHAFVVTGAYPIPPGFHLADRNSTFGFVFLWGIAEGGQPTLPVNPGYMDPRWVEDNHPDGSTRPQRVYMAVLESDTDRKEGILSSAAEFANAAAAERATDGQDCDAALGWSGLRVGNVVARTIAARDDEAQPSQHAKEAVRGTLEAMREAVGGTALCA